VKLIPFSQNFEGREEKGLQGKLLAELPGILNWALEGLKAWHIQGVGKCSAVDSATEEYRQESDIVGQWLADRTVKAPGARMDAAEAYQDFSVWKGGATKFENKQWFGRRMTDHGFKSIKLSGKRIYEGIGLEFVGK
jgi:putative DNA primase/helicase